MKSLLLITLLIWIFVTYASFAFAEQNQIDTTFINYEKFHKEPISISDDEVSKQSIGQIQDKPTPKKSIEQNSGQDYTAKSYGQGEIQNLIRQYSQLYGIDPATPLCIAKLESNFNPNAKNKTSTASGVYQYLSSTWKSTDEGKAGLSVFDAEANIKAAIKYMAIHKSVNPWTVSNRCPLLTFIP